MRRAFIVVLLSALGSSVPVFAQQTWARTYGGKKEDAGKAVVQTRDGCYLAVGYTRSNHGNNVYVVKTDASGNLLRTRTYRMNGASYPYFVQETPDGGYLIAVRLMGTTDGITYPLLKIDANGDTLLVKEDGGLRDYRKGFVRQTADGCFIDAHWGPDIYLSKTNASGDTLWKKTYGGEHDDHVFSLQQTADGGYIIAGSTSSFGSGSTDVYLIKINGKGDTLWTRTYGGKDAEEGRYVQQTKDGGYIVVGKTYSFGAGDWDVYLGKVTSK